MNSYSLLYLYIFIILHITSNMCVLPKNDNRHTRLHLHNELHEQVRKRECCKNNITRCCKISNNSTDIEIRAVFVKCPNAVCDEGVAHRGCKKFTSSTRELGIKQVEGSDEDELLTQSTIINCRQKLVLTIKVSNRSSDSSNNNEYLVVDHVYDPLTKKSTRILTPYVIKIKQQPIMQLYGLKFLNVVNSKAREEVYNKHDGNYTGCHMSSNKRTCGKITYNGKLIPYSQGFCCSCDVLKNTRKQPELAGQYAQHTISYGDPAYLLDGAECPVGLRSSPENFNYEKHLDLQLNKTTIKKVSASTIAIPTSLYFNGKIKANQNEQSVNKTKISNIQKRQIQSSGTQRRGGQNCADRYTPTGVDADTYHESTHCLRFSDLWYTVYHLQQPILEHVVFLQIFEKHEDLTGSTTWRDLTKGTMVRVGTLQQQYLDEKRSISISYEADSQKIDLENVSVNYKSTLLLVPEGTQKYNEEKYPELKAGPPEYLMVHSSQISTDGDQCDVAGVGFEAFFKQPNRCSQPRGTCLDNQPHDLWKHDHQAEKIGKKGCFFLKYYGKLPQDPIRKNPKTQEQFLVFEHPGPYSNTINLEIRADFNSILGRQSSAKITEVYIDSTSPSKTTITIKTTNSGLTSNSFLVKLTDCPLKLAVILNDIESKLVLIPPQHQHVFNFEIKHSLPIDRFHCTIEMLNFKRELVALRRIRLQKFDRCICTWHCLCACVGSSEGLKCVPMSLQHYHAAGFQGSLPITTLVVKYTFLDDMLSLIMYTLVSLLLILLLLGLIKGLIGLLCCPVIGMWGLDIILDLPKPMKHYHELDLMNRKLLYDSRGWPVHPDTKQKVRSVTRITEFCINFIFFFAYPLNVSILILKRCCCPKLSCELQEYRCTQSDSDLSLDKRQNIQLRKKETSNEILSKDSNEELTHNRAFHMSADSPRSSFDAGIIVNEGFEEIVKRGSEDRQDLI